METEIKSTYIFETISAYSHCDKCYQIVFDDDVKTAVCLGLCKKMFHLDCWTDPDVVRTHTDQHRPLKVVCSDCEFSRFDPVSILPVEIMHYIFTSYLPVNDLKACSLVSHEWNAISKCKTIWNQRRKENAVFHVPPQEAQGSQKAADGSQKANCINWPYLARKTLDLPLNLNHLHRFDTDGISYGIMAIVEESPQYQREWVLHIGCLDDNSCIQKIPICHHSPVFKMTTNILLIITGSIFSLYKKKKVFELVKTWSYNKDVENYVETEEDSLMSAWSLEGLIMNPYFIYFKFINVCELHVWSVDSCKLVKKVNFPDPGTADLRSNTCGDFCVCFVGVATPSKAVVLNGCNELVWSFSNYVVGFSSNKRYVGFMLLESHHLTALVYDYNHRLFYRYVCDFGNEVGAIHNTGFNCHDDGTIMYTSDCDTFYCCMDEELYTIKSFVATDSWSFRRSSVILKNGLSLCMFNSTSKSVLSRSDNISYVFVYSYPTVFKRVNYRFNINNGSIRVIML